MPMTEDGFLAWVDAHDDRETAKARAKLRKLTYAEVCALARYYGAHVPDASELNELGKRECKEQMIQEIAPELAADPRF